MKNRMKKLIAAAITLLLGLSSAFFTFSVVYADEASNQEEVGNTDNNSGKSISMYYGDFDYDGKITLKDAKQALQLAVGIETREDDYVREERELFGDIDGRGITLTDAKEYLRMAVGIIPPKEGDFSIEFSDEINKYISEDGKLETVYLSGGRFMTYIPDNYRYERLYPDNEIVERFFDGITLFDCRIDETKSLGMKLTMMELFDTTLSDLYNYNYYYMLFPDWCETLGYDNFKISLENTDAIWKIKVDNSSPIFYEELSSKDISFRAHREGFFCRIPKTERYEGKEVLTELKLTYGMGFENPQDIEWAFEKLDNVEDATQSACLVTDESAVPENIRDKCDFDNYDYIIMTIPFNVEDCYDHFHADINFYYGGIETKTVKEMYDLGDITKPEGFDAATYLNDKVWLNEDSNAKVINLKSFFSIYEKCYYEDIGNCGTALIKVEKGKYDGYKLNLKVFGNENLSISCMD